MRRQSRAARKRRRKKSTNPGKKRKWSPRKTRTLLSQAHSCRRRDGSRHSKISTSSSTIREGERWNGEDGVTAGVNCLGAEEAEAAKRRQQDEQQAEVDEKNKEGEKRIAEVPQLAREKRVVRQSRQAVRSNRALGGRVGWDDGKPSSSVNPMASQAVDTEGGTIPRWPSSLFGLPSLGFDSTQMPPAQPGEETRTTGAAPVSEPASPNSEGPALIKPFSETLFPEPPTTTLTSRGQTHSLILHHLSLRILQSPLAHPHSTSEGGDPPPLPPNLIQPPSQPSDLDSTRAYMEDIMHPKRITLEYPFRSQHADESVEEWYECRTRYCDVHLEDGLLFMYRMWAQAKEDGWRDRGEAWRPGGPRWSAGMGA